MSIYLPASLQGFAARWTAFSTWVDHLSFGYDLVAALRPSVIVELGTEAGLSYFCFCQSVQEHALGTRCFAVDTWRGDEHTGEYDEDVYQDVVKHNQEHYADFSTLLRMRFADAVDRFEYESIDLIHIDGYHTYEAVQTDFETWYPKVAPGGIVLFHDTMARLRDFGAWRFWNDLSQRPETFTFHHGFGLGVLRKPGGSPRDEPLLRLLFEPNAQQQALLRAFYVHASEFQELGSKRLFVQQYIEEQRRKHEAATEPEQ